MRREKRNFRINVVLVVSALLVFTLLAICCYLDHQSNYLIGTEFSKKNPIYGKYQLLSSTNFDYQSGTIIPVTNYKEYKKVISYYNIRNKNELSKEDFKNNNYIYLIMNESSCKEETKIDSYLTNGDNITIYINNNNCSCILDNTNTYIYEIEYNQEINEETTFKVEFLDKEAKEVYCDL